MFTSTRRTNIEIEVLDRCTLLTTFGTARCTVLDDDGCPVDLPKSTIDGTISIMLRPDDQSLTNAGRWEVLQDDEHHTIHNSMRPPPLPSMETDEDLLTPLDDRCYDMSREMMSLQAQSTLLRSTQMSRSLHVSMTRTTSL